MGPVFEFLVLVTKTIYEGTQTEAQERANILVFKKSTKINYGRQVVNFSCCPEEQSGGEREKSLAVQTVKAV